ncbi:profilin-2-like [Latimeria chalumnae]|uniref:profilin-2-like n=1 Tax=Latimeria chalumnae TaxID=7897 RepID=UPI0006D939F6|nr:PREDICTED: profilin-2-like [Latimeria chalumnae]|eukprot:XP_014345080.1 PREDICTED: profilin-2-like [Latimeria chalumnae]
MSAWQAWVESALCDKKCSDVCFIGDVRDPTPTIWGGTEHMMKITTAEILNLLKKDSRDTFYSTGATLAGVKYTCLQDSLYDGGLMKLKEKRDTEPKSNVSIIKTDKMLIIVRALEGHCSVTCDKAFLLADQLKAY